MPVVKASPQAAAVGRRAQPIRQTRSNPVRNSARIGGASATSQISSGSVQLDGDAAKSHSFLPALTHFTDAIDALPKEVMRHFALLKEVDAKLFGPEKALMKLTDIILGTMNPNLPSPRGAAGPETDALDVDPTQGPQLLEFVAGGERKLEPQIDDTSDVHQRRLFYQLRLALTEVLASLDEKNRVMATATQVLDKQLTRCDSIYPYLDHEISDEARYGSLNHWAYAEKGDARNNGVSNERSRRDGAGGNGHSGGATIITEEAAAASRSESRREAMMARKNRLHPPDVGAIDSNSGRNRAGPAISTTASTTTAAPNASKKGNNGNVKSRKSGEASSAHAGVVPEIVSSSVDSFPNKRRRTEKPTPNRVAAVAGGTNSPASESLDASNKGDTQSHRGTAGLEVPKKRVRNGAGTSGNTRKRNVTAPSAGVSPSLASSPLNGQFDPRDLPTKNQVSAAGQRSTVGQNRRESVQSLPPDAGGNGRRRPSSSASSKVTQAHKRADSEHATTTATAMATNQINSESKSASKMSAKHPHRESSIDVKAGRGGNVEPKGGSSSTGRSKESVEQPLKREDTDGNLPSGSSNYPLPARRGSKPSKAPTPAASAVPDMLRSRSSRGAAAEPSSKRLHKRGASTTISSSSAPPSAALSSVAGTTAKTLPQPTNPSEGEEGDGRHRSSLRRDGHDEEEIESGVGDSSSGGGAGTVEPRYCHCNQVSYGSMVACDADDCPREWFHLSCVGLTRAPGKNEVWYCNECKDRLHKGRPQPSGGNSGSGGSGGSSGRGRSISR